MAASEGEADSISGELNAKKTRVEGKAVQACARVRFCRGVEPCKGIGYRSGDPLRPFPVLLSGSALVYRAPVYQEILAVDRLGASWRGDRLCRYQWDFFCAI